MPASVNRQSAIDNRHHLRSGRASRTSARAVGVSSQIAAHEIVAALARRFDAILPARFGAFIEQQELFHIVQLRREILTEGLASVRGHEQMTVRIFGGAPQTSRVLTPNTTGTAYLERRRAVQRGPLPPVAERIEPALAQSPPVNAWNRGARRTRGSPSSDSEGPVGRLPRPRGERGSRVARGAGHGVGAVCSVCVHSRHLDMKRRKPLRSLIAVSRRPA